MSRVSPITVMSLYVLLYEVVDTSSLIAGYVHGSFWSLYTELGYVCKPPGGSA